MNIDALIPRLETGVRRLTGNNQDHAQEINGVGWGKVHQQVGESLFNSIGHWGSAQVLKAWEYCSRYRITQLNDLEIPHYNDPQGDVLERQLRDKEAKQVESDKGYGLVWSEPKKVDTHTGPKLLEVAQIPEGSPFWSLYKTKKDKLSAAGITVGKNAVTCAWQARRWTSIGTQKPDTIAQNTAQEVPDPEIDSEGLLDWQTRSTSRIVGALQRYNVCLDASEVGTGKTFKACKAIQVLKKPALVVCPLAVIPSWRKAAQHFGIRVDCINYELVRRGTTQWGQWKTDQRGKKQWAWTVPADTLLVLDEVHRCKGQTSQNSKLLIEAKRSGLPLLLLSATAATSPIEMKAIGYALGLFGTPSEHWSWAKSNGCKEGRFGGLEFRGNQDHLASISQSIFRSKGTRIRVKELGSAFPETQIETRLVPVGLKATKEINKAYEEAQEVIMRVREKERTDADNPLVALLRARQLSEAAKIPAMVEMVEDAVEQGMSVAVFCCFSETIQAIHDALKTSVSQIGRIEGGQHPLERQKAIEDFQEDRSALILCNIQAGGVGVSLHCVKDRTRLALVSPSYSAIELVQTLGRVHRAGGKNSIQKILYADGTIEAKVAQSLEKKLKNLQALNDSDLLEAFR